MVAGMLAVGTCIGAGSAVAGTNYYIRAGGSDSRSGTSTEDAWATLARASGLHLGPGDRVLLEGGHVFSGTLELDASCQGTTRQPVIVASYGTGRAVIYGGDGDAVRVVGARGVAVTNLTILGSGPQANRQGSGVVLRQSADVLVDQIDVSGFQHAGVFVDASRDVRVTRVYAHNNGFAGILAGYGGSREISRNVYIGYSRALNNPGNPNPHSGVSGSGICMWDVHGGVVEYCEAAYNGWAMDHDGGNGPVGIWLAFCRDVVIQHCVSHDNRSTSGDGGGFDFDSACHNCLMQYNYSYGNAGCGFLLCAYDEAPENGLSGCTIRFCISENDGQKDHRASLYVYNGNNQKDMQVYHNIFHNEAGRACVASTGGIPATFAFRNNLFIARGEGRFVRNIGAAAFHGNAYWNPDGPGNWDGETTLEAWRQNRGHELLNGAPVGLFADPQLEAPGRGEKITDPAKLPALKAYSSLAWSPLIGAGLDLRALFGTDIGPTDFYGRPLPAAGPWCIGVGATTDPLRQWREEYNGQTAEMPAEWRTLADPLPAPPADWLFRADPANRGLSERWFAADPNPADWIPVRVPGFWAETKAVGNYQGYGWYRTTFTAPAAWKGRHLMLRFAAVDEEAWVYVNGQLVREHSVQSEGRPAGVLWEEPFVADVPPEALKYGQVNVLFVRVSNAAANGGIWRPMLAHAAPEE